MSDTPEIVTIGVRRLDPDLPMLTYAHSGDAGADLPLRQDCEIPPRARVLVDTGVAVAIPEGWVGLVHPRSGLAARLGLTIVNTPGTIDSGYRGEIKVCLLNTDSQKTIRLKRGDLIAQLLFQRVGRADFVIVDELSATDRGTRGYGSSGGVKTLED